MNIKLKLKNTTTNFNDHAKKYLSRLKDGSILWEAINYGVVNGGKRIRPFLIIELSKLLNIKKSNYRYIQSRKTLQRFYIYRRYYKRNIIIYFQKTKKKLSNI